MIRPLKEVIENLSAFEDSFELSEKLLEIYNDDKGSPDAYYFAECSTHIVGLYSLAKEMTFHLTQIKLMLEREGIVLGGKLPSQIEKEEKLKSEKGN